MKLTEARILVVDDEETLRDIFAKWLRGSGCLEVRTAANGVEAIEAIEAHPIDVLVTDVRMPVMDGVTLVRRLAQRGERIACIIFVSGFGDVDQREMYNLGVEAFLAKPFRLEELSDAIELAIAEGPDSWKTPMPIPPRQSVELELDAPTDPRPSPVSAPPEFGFFRLGRGGFSTRAPDVFGLGKIAFRCVFAQPEAHPVATEPPPELIGQGYVRWRSRADQTVGIEFAFLESPGREWVLAQIEAASPRSYIPTLGGKQPAADSGSSLPLGVLAEFTELNAVFRRRKRHS
jgi:CheY-like chemotaxis protein